MINMLEDDMIKFFMMLNTRGATPGERAFARPDLFPMKNQGRPINTTSYCPCVQWVDDG